MKGISRTCLFFVIVSLGLTGSGRDDVREEGKSVPVIGGDKLESDQAFIWYLYHSGWAVKTRNYLLIFDYTEPSERPTKRSLDSGSIDPAEIGDQNVAE